MTRPAVTRDTHRAVVPNAGGFPAPVVPARVALVELEAVVLVPADVQQRDPEGAFPFNTENAVPDPQSRRRSPWLLSPLRQLRPCPVRLHVPNVHCVPRIGTQPGDTLDPGPVLNPIIMQKAICFQIGNRYFGLSMAY